MVDAINSNAHSLLRAQAAGSVAPKQAPSHAVVSNLQKTAAAPVKSTAVPQATKLAGSTSANLPRGSLYDFTV